jgi:hypothetical protein
MMRHAAENSFTREGRNYILIKGDNMERITRLGVLGALYRQCVNLSGRFVRYLDKLNTGHYPGIDGERDRL